MRSGLIRKETAVAATTERLDHVMIDPVTGEIVDQKDLAEHLLAQAKEQGVNLVDPGGLLNQLTKSVKGLVFDDLGKQVVLNESNGDRNSGNPHSISNFDCRIILGIGGNQTYPDLNAQIEFVDE